MTDRFEDIKVGDVVYINLGVGVRFDSWSSSCVFYKEFLVTLHVEKVTKTQFTAGGWRFFKGGRGFGDNGYTAIEKGSKVHLMGQGVVVADSCQRSEYSDYKKKANRISEVLRRNKFQHYTKLKDIEIALEVTKLYERIEELLEGGK